MAGVIGWTPYMQLQKAGVTSYFGLVKVGSNIQVPIYSLQAFTSRCMSSKKRFSKNYQYIMKSTVPTMHFQKSLPRLPIPKLEETCQRYLRSQQPLLNAESFERTSSYVKQFMEKEGIACQEALVKENKVNSHTSYITKPWFDMYLEDRKPLPINYNPFLVFVDHPRSEYNDQIVKASNLVISSLRFFRSLNEDLLEPEVYHMNPDKTDTDLFRKVTRLLPSSISWYGAYLLFKAFPLDMSQYKNLFNSTRVPEIAKDRIKHVPGMKHILVMRKGNLYVFDALDKNGNILEPDVIFANVEHIVHLQDSPAEFPLGVMTTENRDTWARARNHLESLGNTAALEAVDSSLFALVLDDKPSESSDTDKVRQFLHADGVNRWFDKSFNLIVSGDGTAGVNFEHSWGDGVAVLRYFNDVHQDSVHHLRSFPGKGSNSSNAAITVSKLDFKLDDRMKNLITEAKTNYKKTCDSLDVSLLDYKKFGRNLCKPLNISPDSMMQLAFQMAYFKMTKKFTATYESCSTAAFKHGRTETVRPCTLETQKICLALEQLAPPSKTELQKMMVECSKYHSKLIKEAAMGQGFDRHLYALRLKAQELGLSPAIFSDNAYAKINHNVLSTSTLSSDNIQLGAFGPVVKDGYGIAYSIWKERLGFIVTNYREHTDGPELLQALESSFKKLYDILS